MVGDEDELGILTELVEHFQIASHVGLVQHGVHLVQDAEGGGRNLEEGENQRHRGQTALTARQQGQPLGSFARKSDLDVHTGHLVALGGIGHQHQAGFPAAKEAGEKGLELLLHPLERPAEGALHQGIQLIHQFHKVGFGLAQVGHLRAQEGNPLVELFVLLEDFGHHRSQTLPLLTQGAHLLFQRFQGDLFRPLFDFFLGQQAR